MAIDSFTRQQMTERRRLMRQLDKQAKQRATVIHEAGHAVVHHVMGMRVIRATIFRRPSVHTMLLRLSLAGHLRVKWRRLLLDADTR